jgi:hypothetical protein
MLYMFRVVEEVKMNLSLLDHRIPGEAGDLEIHQGFA